jgi:hypothetical protein
VFFHTLAPAELTQGKPAESSVGTGFLVQFRGRKYFVSALHNFFYKECALAGVIASWEAAKFKLRGTQPVNFEDARTFPPEKMTLDTGVSLPHSFPEGLVIDEEHDLIAVEVGGDHGHFATAHFLNMEQDVYNGDLQDQMSLVTLGNPFAGRIPIPGNQKASALIPHLDHVLFDVNLDTSWAATDYLSPDYFLCLTPCTRNRLPHTALVVRRSSCRAVRMRSRSGLRLPVLWERCFGISQGTMQSQRLRCRSLYVCLIQTQIERNTAVPQIYSNCLCPVYLD